MSTVKERLLVAIPQRGGYANATTPDDILEQTLDYLEYLKSKQSGSDTPVMAQDSKPILRGSRAKDLLKFAGTWQGDDGEDCLRWCTIPVRRLNSDVYFARLRFA